MTTVTVSQPQLQAEAAAPGGPVGVSPVQGPTVVLELGIRGPEGPSAAGSRHEHVQSAASTTWTVNHNLGVRPAAVTVRSVGGLEVDAEVVHTSDNQCVISFGQPFAGTAHVI